MATGYQSIPHGATLRDPSAVTHCEACGEPGEWGSTLRQSDALVTNDGQMAVVCGQCHLYADLLSRALSAAMHDPLDGSPYSLNESEPLAN